MFWPMDAPVCSCFFLLLTISVLWSVIVISSEHISMFLPDQFFFIIIEPPYVKTCLNDILDCKCKIN